MSDTVHVTKDGDIAIVTVNNPPVNAIGLSVRQGLWDVIPTLDADDSVRAVVLICAGRTFIAGADIREFDGGALDPWLPDLVSRMHASKTPWVAAIHGTALGGGLETAMGAHYRVAVPSAKVGLPEVALGIIPGAGGTQRTPRLTGAEAAAKLVTSGAPISATEAARIGLIDRVVDDLEPDAIAFARSIADQPVPRLDTAPATTDLTDADWSALSDEVRKRAKGQLSPVRGVEAVRLAFELPLDEGMERERDIFLQLKETDQSKALRHAFFAERAVAKPAALKTATPRDIARMAVVGGGLMGSGIATAALGAGVAVTIIEQTMEAAEQAQARVAANLDSGVRKGRMTVEQRDALLANLRVTNSYHGADGADLCIEAVFEDADTKRAVFEKLAPIAGPDAILATNTSYIDPTSFTDGIENPGRIMGLHFFSPAHIMRLVEVVRTPRTDADVLATGFALAKKMRKVAVLSGVCDGFIGNRILGAYGRMAGYLLEDGATPQQIDGAMKRFGMPMGPFEMFDMAGLQIGYANRKREAATRPEAQRYSRVPDLIVEKGWLGQKTQQGYYDYADGSRQAVPSDAFADLLAREREALNLTPRDISEEEIVASLHAVQVNEAAMILAEGVAERPLDIDVVKLMGYGYPRWRGGPMMEADRIGTDTVLATMMELSEGDPGSWSVAPLLARLGADGTPFSSLN